MPIALAHKSVRPPGAGPPCKRVVTYCLAELCEYLRYSASRWERQVISRLTRHEYHLLYVLARHELRHYEGLSHHVLHKVTGLDHKTVGRAVRGLATAGFLDCWESEDGQHWARIAPGYLAELEASGEVQFEIDEMKNAARTLERIALDDARARTAVGIAIVAEVAARASLAEAVDALATREKDDAEAAEALS